jgi:uncharacterized protein YcfJ
MANAEAMEQSPWTGMNVAPMQPKSTPSDLSGALLGGVSGAMFGSQFGGGAESAPMQAGESGSAWAELQNRLNENKQMPVENMAGDPISTQMELQNRLGKRNFFSSNTPKTYG